MKNQKNFADILKKERESRGLTQEELAKKLDVSKATISLYESGDRYPSLDVLHKIAEVLEIPLSAILELKTPKADLTLALRSQGITNQDDIVLIKQFIKRLKNDGNDSKTE